MAKCTKKNGLVFLSNRTKYSIKNGAEVPSRIFEDEFPQPNGEILYNRYVEAGYMKSDSTDKFAKSIKKETPSKKKESVS